ncbi:MAG: prepilin-type N-terminal cleavage/methylation domain-containing protein [SAR324 cluster bacterium]|uniref:Prepilin-type N-terminal cleavage/methylation domain-containing protein n=1 Tax=SAR324 cluster bacterium TaxID=2024889 RepID=A0A7X9FV80_9DELT|nr:prepilin-type N-terminal cleavage/methylation domain-containing protein [SAR324 cluster bacterium]
MQVRLKKIFSLIRQSLGGSQGFSLIEVMATILILAVTGLAIARSTIVSYRIMHRNERNAIALQLALQAMEEYATLSPVTLSASNDRSEPLVIYNNMKFARTSTVTVNGDNSRTVSIVVTPVDSELGGAATLTNTFPLWGTM